MKSQDPGSIDLEGRKLAVLGAGKLGDALLSGLLAGGGVSPSQVVVTARRAARAEAVAKRHGCRAEPGNREAVRGASMVLLCVKPFTVHDVLEEIRDELDGTLLVSVAAGVTTEYLERVVGRRVPVVRAMPNTPALLREGMTALARGRHADARDLERARAVFASVGRVVEVEEKHMDAVTGLSASGPAFLYVVIESMAEAGVKVGLPRDVATELAAQTVLGAARMVLETGEHPAKLKDMVTTPAGCTVDGLLELEAGGLRVTVIKAIVEATRRAGELSHE